MDGLEAHWRTLMTLLRTDPCGMTGLPEEVIGAFAPRSKWFMFFIAGNGDRTEQGRGLDWDYYQMNMIERLGRWGVCLSRSIFCHLQRRQEFRTFHHSASSIL